MHMLVLLFKLELLPKHSIGKMFINSQYSAVRLLISVVISSGAKMSSSKAALNALKVIGKVTLSQITKNSG